MDPMREEVNHSDDSDVRQPPLSVEQEPVQAILDEGKQKHSSCKEYQRLQRIEDAPVLLNIEDVGNDDCRKYSDMPPCAI